MKLGLYQHYKWNNYEVIWIAKHSETLEELVVYKALYNSEEFWDNALRVRPLKMFQETIEIDGVTKPRFPIFENNQKTIRQWFWFFMNCLSWIYIHK